MKNFFNNILLLIIAALVPVSSYIAPNKLTGSCGLMMNVSKWGSPVRYGQADPSSNNFLLLINFDSGTISGYATNVTFGSNATESPTYVTGMAPGNFTFTQTPDVAAGFYKITPSNLDQMPEWKVLPVNGGNTFLFIWSGNNRAGAGGTGVCQKI